MVRAAPMITSFNAGEWSPLLEGHLALERFGDSCRTLQNLIPLKQGPVTRRGGTYFVKEVKDSDDDTALIPFEFNVTQAYQIEAGDTYFRFYRNNSPITLTAQNITGITQANPAVLTYSGSDTYANGDEVYVTGVSGMTEVNGKYYLVSNVDTGANTFELQDIDGNDIDSRGYTAYTSGGTVAEIYQITSPYSATDLYTSAGEYNFQYAQSADVLYIAHPDYAPRSLARTAHTSWTATSMTFDDGPYLAENATSTTLTLSGTTGSVTVTASATTGINGGDGFQTTDVGRLIRWKDPANEWTWLKITARSSTTVVTATISGQDASAGTATTSWRLGVYSDTTGWPKAITFYQDRVVLAGCADYPDRYDMTKTGGYSDTTFQFAPSDVDGTVADDAAIDGTLQSGDVNQIQWAGSDNHGLVIGTASKDWIVRPSTTGEVLTQGNAKADPFASTGSAYVKPIEAESGLIYLQRARRKIFDVIYSFERDQLKPRDLTILSEHITRNNITQMAFQQEPLNVVWMVRGDGALVGMTYYPDEAVFACHKHIIGGTDAAVKCLSVIPSSDGSRDELWMIVERTINGVTRKYIEYMTRYYEDDMSLDDTICVDSALTYDSTATATITGLDHLEGETVKVMVDGKSHPDLTVSEGAITLANDVTGSTVQIGLSNTWILQPQRIEAGARDGVAQGKTKRITGFVIRLLNALGLKHGPDASNLIEHDFDQGTAYDETPTLFTGDTVPLKFDGGYDQNGVLYLTHDDVFPITILAIMPDITTYDRG